MRMHRRLVVAAWILALFAGLSTAAPSAANGTTPYSANFPNEETVFRPCPPGVPTGSICFTGSDHSGQGNSTPPGTTATEDFAGFVDLSRATPTPCPDGSTGHPDHNIVAISTPAGRLFLTTDGTDCISTGHDHGVWQAHGGTGIFEGASGSGTVDTQAAGGMGTPSDPIRSSSTYTGTLTLN